MGKNSAYASGELTDSIFFILLSLLQPRHGYKIMQFITEETKGNIQIGPATMYTTLGKLNKEGWIEEVISDDTKKVYFITAIGREKLFEDYRRRAVFVEIASRLLEVVE